MRGHSIELRNLQAKIQTRICSEAPEAYNSVSGFYSKPEVEPKAGLRRCESANALAKRPKSNANQSTQRLSVLEAKYRALEEDYTRVLREVKTRGEIFARQKEEIDRLNQVTLKEEREIERLRQLLRLSEKKSQCVQTDDPPEEISWRKRIEVSTGESELTSETRCERSTFRREESRDRVETRNNSEKQKLGESRMLRTNGKERAPLVKKYKFIPTLNFKHL